MEGGEQKKEKVEKSEWGDRIVGMEKLFYGTVKRGRRKSGEGGKAIR